MDSRLSIGTLILDHQTNQLIVNGTTQQIEPRLVAVLQFLFQNKEQVVRREQLIEAVWKGRVVSDNAVSRSISQVRKLLSQSSAPQPTIETIPRVGYRLQLNANPITMDKGLTHAREVSNKEKLTSDRSSSSFIKLPDSNSLKVVLFLAFSLAIFGRYFYQLISDSESTVQFVQSSLTLSPGAEKLPKISPNGRWLAYSAESQERKGEYLFVIDLDSKRTIKITQSPHYFIDLAWSPDSQSIIYSTWNSLHDRRCSIRLVRLESQKDNLDLIPLSDRNLFNCSERAATKLAWNELGNKIYMTSRPSYDRPYFVQSYALDSKRLEQVTLPPQAGNLRGDYYISGSLSGKHLAIIRYLGTARLQLQVYNTADKSFIATQKLDSDIKALTWLKDERLLISRDNNLYLYDYNSNTDKFFYAIGKNSGGLTADQDGRKIAFTVLESDINLVEYQWNATKGEFDLVKLLAESSAIEAAPSYSADQTQFVFLSNRTGSNQIWLSDSDGTVAQLSDSPISLTLSPLNWSPDDQSILFQHDDEIYTIEVATGKITRIIDREHKAANADWSADGSSIFYSSEKSGEWQIWQYLFQPNSHQQITVNGGYSAKQDRHKNLYVSRIHQDGLWRLDYDPKGNHFLPANLVLADYSGTNWLSWQLLGKSIYYFGSTKTDVDDNKVFGIMQLDLSTYTTKLWFPFDSNHQRYFSVASDGLIVTRVTRNEGSIELLSENQP